MTDPARGLIRDLTQRAANHHIYYRYDDVLVEHAWIDITWDLPDEGHGVSEATVQLITHLTGLPARFMDEVYC